MTTTNLSITSETEQYSYLWKCLEIESENNLKIGSSVIRLLGGTSSLGHKEFISCGHLTFVCECFPIFERESLVFKFFLN